MADLMFPLWQVTEREYDVLCAYLALTPRPVLLPALTRHLADAALRGPQPRGFARFLAGGHLSRFRVARLDLTTKLLFAAHPLRHRLNGVLALHEFDAAGYAEMSATKPGSARLRIAVSMLGFAINLLLTSLWLVWQLLAYLARLGVPAEPDLAGTRVFVSGVARGLGRDLFAYCLERGAEVVGTVRTEVARAELREQLPRDARATLIVADLARSGALLEALRNASIDPDSLGLVVLSAGTKRDGESVRSLAAMTETFQVNLFTAVELIAWLRPPGVQSTLPRPKIALVSSIGRWHGMHWTGGYNASKAALSVWGESLEMELSDGDDYPITIVEPGMFASAMMRQTALTKLLSVPRREVARRTVMGALAGTRAVRPPLWFALLTWTLLLAGRHRRARVLRSAKR